MKRPHLALFFILMWTFAAWGQGEESSAESTEASSSLEYFVQLGAEVRARSAVNPALKEPAPGMALSLFLLRDQFGLLEELTFFRDSSSSGNLHIKVQTVEWNQWIHYLIRKDQTFNPYFGVGLGLSQDKVETTLSSSKRTDRSRIFVNAAAVAGLLADFTRWGVVMEARAWKFEQKKDPVFSGLFSLRFKF